MKKIIVPVDFSEHSENALKVAARLARRNDAELLVLHMLEMSEIMLTSSEGVQNEKTAFFIKMAEQRFKKFLQKDYLKGLPITPIVKNYKVFSEVNDVAQAYQTDLIVMGSKGTSGLKGMIIGSNTERVVRYAEAPVLVIKKDLSNIDFKVVVYPCSFSEGTISAYQKIKKLIQNMPHSKLYFLHVNRPSTHFRSTAEMEKTAADFFKKADGNLDSMKDLHYVSDYSVEKGLLAFSKKIDADLIAMPTHGRKGLSYFFEGSIGEDVANHASLPVITVKV